MASKSRGGLSKPEYARAQAAKAKTATNPIATKAAQKKSVSPLVGAGPLLPNQTRVGGTVTGAGPLLPNQTRDMGNDYSQAKSTPTSSREKASKAKSSMSSGLSGANTSGITFGGGEPTDFSKAFSTGGLKQGGGAAAPIGGGGGLLDGLKGMFSSMGKNSVNRSLGMASDNTFLTDSQRQDNLNSGLGIGTAKASGPKEGESFADFSRRMNDPTGGGGVANLQDVLNKSSQPDLPTGYGDNGETFFNNNTKSGTLVSDFATPGTNFSRPGSEAAYAMGQNPRDFSSQLRKTLGIETAQAQEDPYANARSFKDSGVGGSDPYQHPSIPGADVVNPFGENGLQNPELTNGNNEVAPPRPDIAGPGSKQSMGAGKYSNGALLSQNPAEDDYIKQLRKAYSGDGGIKELRNQFEELIKQLDPTYAQYQKEGTDALNQQLMTNSNQLASVMNAGNVGDSEQRTQQLARLQGDTTTALGTLLAKLSTAKAGEVSNYRSQLQGKLADASQSRQTNQQKLMEAINSYKNQQFDQRYKNASLAEKGGSTKAGSLQYMGDDANGNPVYYNSTTGQQTTGTGLKRKQSSPLEEAMAAMLGQGQGGQQVQYDENGRPYIERT